MKNKISVILPCYNAESTIYETLLSINSQNCTFQLIIIDDGSTDNTLSIIHSFEFRNYIDLNLTSRKNKGFLITLNEGINLVDGDLVARIDADDIWESTHLLELEREFEKNSNLVLVGSNAYVINERGENLFKTDLPLTKSSIIKYMLNDNPFIHSSVMFRLETYKMTSGYLIGTDSKSMHIADYNLWFELSKLGDCINVFNPTLKYRKQINSMSRNVFIIDNYKARLEVMGNVYRYYKEHFLFSFFSRLKVSLSIYRYNILKK